MDGSTIVMLIIAVLVLIIISTLTFFVCRRLSELHRERLKPEGHIFVDDTGDMFSEFDIPMAELIKRDYILVKVTHVKPKTKE